MIPLPCSWITGPGACTTLTGHFVISPGSQDTPPRECIRLILTAEFRKFQLYSTEVSLSSQLACALSGMLHYSSIGVPEHFHMRDDSWLLKFMCGASQTKTHSYLWKPFQSSCHTGPRIRHCAGKKRRQSWTRTVQWAWATVVEDTFFLLPAWSERLARHGFSFVLV